MTEPTDRAPNAAGKQSLARSALLSVAVGAAICVTMAALVYSFIAIPMYMLARIDPDGLDRPFLRDGFLRLALPLGVVVGLACGALVGVWYRRGGQLPEHRSLDDREAMHRR